MKYDWNYESKKWKEKLIMWVVWGLPKSWIYWASIRLMANATTGEYSNQVVPELTCIVALKRWDACMVENKKEAAQ